MIMGSNPEFSLLENDKDLARSYFAAHAPEQVPEWFRHNPPPPPPTQMPDLVAMVEYPEDKEAVRNWLRDVADLPDRLSHVAAARQKFFDDRMDWKLRNQEARYFQWRWYYAERMLEIGQNLATTP